MSSARAFKNYVKTRTYQERAQPAERKKLGFLEKHKDYKKRADATHKYEKARQRLERLAALKNPDEFHTGMTHTESKRGYTVDTRERKRTIDEVHEKTRDDLEYLEHVRQKELKKIERLQASLQMLDETAQHNAAGRKKVVFKDSVEEAKQFSAAEHLDTLPELAQSSLTSVRKDQLAKGSIIVNKEGTYNVDAVKKSKVKSYVELDERLTRALAIESARKKVIRKRDGIRAQKQGRQAIKLVKKDEFGNVVDTIYKWKPVRRR